MMNKLIIIILVILSSVFTASAADTYVFKDEVTEKRYRALVKELRCPKCQNQNLADSNSPIAKDLRNEVYELLAQGKADKEIVDFMVARYGDFVLYRPKVSNVTYVLWFGPAILLLIGVIVVVLILRRNRQPQAKSLSEEQQEKLKNLLKDK